METESTLNEKILKITAKIRKSHPELLKFLDEMTVTLPDEKDPEVTVKLLTSHYNSLVDMLDEYKENDTGKDSSEIIDTDNHTSHKDLSTEINNINISYNDEGEGDIPILFLHGYPFDKSMWKDQLEALKSTNRVIALDIRGFGQSTDEKSELSIDLFGRDLISFMDKMSIEKAIICGLSMGGFVALNVMKNFPNRFEALILCDTQCIADTPEVKENRYKTIEDIKQNGTAAFNEKFIKSVFHPNSLANRKELVQSLRYVVFENSKEVIIAGLVALAEREETCSSLDAIRVPTLIICGREDAVTPLAESEYMQKHIRGSVLKIIDNAGHVSNLEHPDQFNAYLKDFLESYNRSSL